MQKNEDAQRIEKSEYAMKVGIIIIGTLNGECCLRGPIHPIETTSNPLYGGMAPLLQDRGTFPNLITCVGVISFVFDFFFGVCFWYCLSTTIRWFLYSFQPFSIFGVWVEISFCWPLKLELFQIGDEEGWRRKEGCVGGGGLSVVYCSPLRQGLKNITDNYSFVRYATEMMVLKILRNKLFCSFLLGFYKEGEVNKAQQRSAIEQQNGIQTILDKQCDTILVHCDTTFFSLQSILILNLMMPPTVLCTNWRASELYYQNVGSTFIYNTNCLHFLVIFVIST